MGFNDHRFESRDFDILYKCPKCLRMFKVWTEDQTPGFRMKDTLYCPYCDAAVETSMEVEFHVVKEK